MARQGKILIIGHSHARRLGVFVQNGHKSVVQPNFNVNGATVNFHGIGGARVRDLTKDRFVRAVSETRPDTLIIMIGDNDNVHACDAEELAAEIVSVASHFHFSCNVPRICVTQLLPRCQNNKINKDYDEKAYRVNQEIKQLTAPIEYMQFLQFDFARFQVENPIRFMTLQKFFDRGGVHLSPDGYYKLYRGMRSIVIRTVTDLQVGLP